MSFTNEVYAFIYLFYLNDIMETVKRYVSFVCWCKIVNVNLAFLVFPLKT